LTAVEVDELSLAGIPIVQITTLVRLEFIRPGKPVENAFIESFNGRLRDECLNAHVFASTSEAQRVFDAWREDYNAVRPHSALQDRTPAAVGARWVDSRVPREPTAMKNDGIELEITMLRWLKTVLEWAFGRGSFIQLSLQAPNHEGVPGDRRGGSDPRQGPRDFDSRVREPRWCRPSGGNTAVSVREPDDEAAAVVAMGRSYGRAARDRREPRSANRPLHVTAAGAARVRPRARCNR
jgi:hypothetical protein